MGRLASLFEKVRDKRDELVRRAAGKAADVALQGTKRAAFGVADSLGHALEKAIFGDVLPSRDAPAPPLPDPFASLKARERAEREAKEASDADAEVDDELQALKNKLR